MLMTAAPSITITSTTGGLTGLSVEQSFSKQSTMSDLVPCLSCPLFDKDGGKGPFSCLKNVSKLPSRTWQAMYKRAKREQSLFIEAAWILDLDKVLLLFLRKRCRLFCLIGSNTDLLLFFRRSSTNAWYWSWPHFSIICSDLKTSRLATSLLSRTRSSSVPSKNGFPISSITFTSSLTS